MSKWLIHCKFTVSYSKYENMSIIRFDLNIIVETKIILIETTVSFSN